MMFKLAHERLPVSMENHSTSNQTNEQKNKSPLLINILQIKWNNKINRSAMVCVYINKVKILKGISPTNVKMSLNCLMI